MSIPESQLDIWAKVGSQTQSKDTYATIRNALDIKTAPYTGKVDIFLQGSYGNDTNVFGKESDVDIVIQSDAAYFRDLSRLTPMQVAMYEASSAGVPGYPFQTFKTEVPSGKRLEFGVAHSPVT